MAVRSFFTLLHEAKRIALNPALKVYPARPRPRAPTLLTAHQWRRLLQAAASRGPFAYLAVHLAGELGLRTGEIHRLTWDDVDTSDPYAPTVRIRYGERRHTWKERVVKGSRTLTDILEEYRRSLGKEPPPAERLCPWQNPRSLKALFSQLGKEAGLPFPLTGKLLRWRALYLAYAGGASPEVLSRRFGISPRHLQGEVLPVLRRLHRMEVPV